jgi:general secretion pathway protein D
MKLNPVFPVAGLVVITLWLTACSTTPEFVWPEGRARAASTQAGPTAGNVVAPTDGERRLSVTETPKPPTAGPSSTIRPEPLAVAPSEPANITLSFEQIALPAFIQTVFGTLLKQNISIDPLVMQRKDLVTLRAGKEQTASDVAATARLLLKTYGIAVVDTGGGLLRAIPDNTQAGYLPEIRRGRALPEVPLPMRPVFHLLEPQAVRASDISSVMRTMFRDRISVVEDVTRNTLLLSGQPDEVRAAVDALQVIDQPLLKGRTSIRINPGFWPADDLARRLTEILTTEGYSVSIAPSQGSALVLVPVPSINALFAFAVDPMLLGHVSRWATELDRPSNTSRPAGSGFFTYNVLNTDAGALAKTLSEVLGANAPTAPAQVTVPTGASGQQLATAQAEAAARFANRRNSKVVVNAATNTLIIQGTSEEYAQIIPILHELDRPSKQAMIEVTVAEVRLGDTQQFGFEWASSVTRGGSTTRSGTFGITGAGEGAFLISRLNSLGEITARLSALASESRARVLSNPRVLAKNGETASIQVGQEVPVITSQQSSTPAPGSTAGGIIQNITYRNTGVILKVKPVVYSNNQIDLEISQEVSSATTTRTGVTSSPTLDTSKLETKLTLRDGEPALIGGLIRTTRSDGHAGIPFLKDVPVLGQAFRNTDLVDTRNELVILITPYVIADASDARRITEEFRQRLGPWAQPERK